MKKIIGILFLLIILLGYNYIIGIKNTSLMTFLFFVEIVIATGICIFMYMILIVPFIAGWFIRKENGSIFIKFLSKVTVALHMLLLIIPFILLAE